MRAHHSNSTVQQFFQFRQWEEEEQWKQVDGQRWAPHINLLPEMTLVDELALAREHARRAVAQCTCFAYRVHSKFIHTGISK